MHSKDPMLAILHIPVEIIELILVHLSTKDLFSVRLSCSALERKSLGLFKRRHFTTRSVVLTKYNIQTLVDIASHESFGPQISELILVKRLNCQAPLQHSNCSHGDVQYIPYILEVEKRLLVAMNHLPNLVAVTCSAGYAYSPSVTSCHLRIVLSAVQASDTVQLSSLTLNIPRKAILHSDIWPTRTVHPCRLLELQRANTAGRWVLDVGVVGITALLPHREPRRPWLVERHAPLLEARILEPMPENCYVYVGQISAGY